MERDLFMRFTSDIKARQLLTSGDKLLVAVSGGPDSIVLLDLIRRLEVIDFGIFHLNHQLRGEAEIEAEFVAKLGSELGVIVHNYSYDVRQYSKNTGHSIETAARNIRYQFMELCFKEFSYGKIALGHHLDDQAETVLMHLFRGSGTRGLAGMDWKRDQYIRPLLGISKSEILAYCDLYNLKYYHDFTNFIPEATRNKIRLEVIPLIENEFNPQFSRSIYQAAEILRVEDQELDKQARTILADISYHNHGVLNLKREKFMELSLTFQRRILQLCITQAINTHEKVSFNHVEKLRNLICDSFNSFNYSLPLINVIGTAKVVVFGMPKFNQWDQGTLTIPGETIIGNYRIVTEIIDSNHGELESEDMYEDFDYAQLKLPLTFRKRQPGDVIQPFGFNHRKKVKDILIDAKVPRYFRDELPIICDGEEIVMIPGIVRSEKGRITTITRKKLRIVFEHSKHCQSD